MLGSTTVTVSHNRMQQYSAKPISPVMQFVLLLTPVVMSCFFLVYALAGWVVEGRHKLNWSLEAPAVATWTAIGVVTYCIVVLLYARWKGATRYHVLYVSSWGHIFISVLLTISVFVAVKL